MINWFLLSASIISLVGMAFHGVAGQKIYMGNINRSDLESLTKSLSLVSWHIFTIFLLVSAIVLAYVAYYPEFALVTYPIIGVNALGSTLFVFLGLYPVSENRQDFLLTTLFHFFFLGLLAVPAGGS